MEISPQIEAAYARWLERADDSLKPDLERKAADLEALTDAFYRELEFGTAGLRGVIGAGPNCMNIHTVGRATQGLAAYLNERFDEPSVAICRDSRLMGEEFVRVVAEVLAANGIRSFVYPRIEPTPALSFAVRDLGCSAGINITASHNPAQYNGYKVYGPDGCQITSAFAKGVQDAIAAIDVFDGVRRMDFDDALERGLVRWTEEGTLDRFIDAVYAQSLEASGAKGGVSVVYTPLCGTGLECVSRILERIGVADVTVVPEQAEPDGNFPTCPYPNPEFREALECGLALCERVRPDILLATDPDADRVGVAVLHDGDYALITGNEMGVLMLDYICRARAERGEDLSRCVAVTTIVSSSMVDALAAHYGVELRRTLTGFKYIGEQILQLERAGEQDRFILGFEESYGYMTGSHVRDKDAVNASMIICQMVRWHKSQGRDLVNALEGLAAELGHYENRTLNFGYPGAEGASTMARLMAGLRGDEAPAEFAGLRVVEAIDYAGGAPMPVVNAGEGYAPQTLPASDVVELRLEGECKVIVRPSGTEPKIKAYVFAKGATADEAEGKAQALSDACSAMLKHG